MYLGIGKEKFDLTVLVLSFDVASDKEGGKVCSDWPRLPNNFIVVLLFLFLRIWI